MANNINITLKRNNGTDYDTLYPKTVPAQVVGLLTDGKITTSLLPSFVIGGMRYAGTISAQDWGQNFTLGYLSGTNGQGWITSSSSDPSTFVGSYVINVDGGQLTGSTTADGNGFKYVFESDYNESQPPEDVEDWDSSVSATLEPGDWVVFTRYTSGTKTLYFSVINNTYQQATTSSRGIVKLSSQTVYANLTGDNVITDAKLKALVDNANFASAGHNHDGTYQPVDADLTAIAGLAGTSGFLKKTAANTWSLDTNTYSTTSHTHGNITSAGAIGSTSDLVVVTGTSGVLTTQSRSGIDSRSTFPVALATSGAIGGIEVGYTSTETNRAVSLSGNDAYVNLPRQIPAVTLNGSSSTSPGFYAPTAAGTSGQLLVSSGTSVAPAWATINKFLYDTTTGAVSGDIIFDVE